MNSFKLSEMHTYDEAKIEMMLRKLNKAYYAESKTLVSDECYDKIKDFMQLHYPENKVLKEVGHEEVQRKHKTMVALPYWLGSMDKIKNSETDLKKWLNKNYMGENVVISEKLDGVSALYVIGNGDPKLYTRGNGSKGQDISHLISSVIDFKRISISKTSIVIRGELIIKRHDFTNLINKNIVEHQSNARNVVSGIVNAKKPNQNILKVVRFVAYEVIEPPNLPTLDQLQLLKSFNCNNVDHFVLTKNELTIEQLTTKLTKHKQSSEYEIDGLIITNNISNRRNVDGNPKYAFAFKIQSEDVEVTVTHVEWNISKDKYLIPIIHFNKVYLTGVEIQKTTGFNAKYIYDNKINQGTRLTITRSGDVIPYVKEIIQSSAQPMMPDVEYFWIESGVHIYSLNDELIHKKEFENLLIKLDIDGVNTQLINKLYENGITTIRKVLDIDKEKLLTIGGIKDKKATNILSSICKLKENLNIESLMVSSNLFGRGIGVKTIHSILNKYPDIFSEQITIGGLNEIIGIDMKTSKLFLSNIDKFKTFINDNDLQQYCAPVNKHIEQNNIHVCFTGGKDKELINLFDQKRIIVDNAINKNVSYLITSDENSVSTKTKYAIKHNIKIVTKQNMIEILNSL